MTKKAAAKKAAEPKVEEALRVVDLPSDRMGVLKGMRIPLVNVYNYTRGYPEKRALLKETLETVLAKL